MTEYVEINNPSKRLDDFLYKLGVAKHERLEKMKKDYNPEKAICL